MENYIVINGKKAELTPEQLKALGLETEMKSPFERKRRQRYYTILGDGSVTNFVESKDDADDGFYEVANYCTDREMMQQQAYRETLNRLLWRYSMEHKGNEIDWDNRDTYKYSIYYNYNNNRFEVEANYFCRNTNAVYFATESIAKNALRKIIEPFFREHPDFEF